MRTIPHAYAKDLGLARVVLLSRLPFLSPGAGNDDDGWFLVNAAREIAATGRYTTSRFPGYPVQEWLRRGGSRPGGGPGGSARAGRYTPPPFPGYPVQEWLASWVARLGGGPVEMNALSALAAAGAAFAFARLLRRLGAGDAWLLALAFACVPAAYVASVSAMDYLFAVAFLLAACHARLAGRAWLAGAWLGLAIGTRLTSAVLLPAVLLLPPPAGDPRERPRAWLAPAGLDRERTR